MMSWVRIQAWPKTFSSERLCSGIEYTIRIEELIEIVRVEISEANRTLNALPDPQSRTSSKDVHTDIDLVNALKFLYFQDFLKLKDSKSIIVVNFNADWLIVWLSFLVYCLSFHI